MKKIVILGAGGNCFDMVDIIEDINRFHGKEIYRCIGFLDDDPDKEGLSYMGVSVIGKLESASSLPEDVSFVNGIGSVRTFRKKKDIISRSGVPLERFETIIHPTAVLSKSASIGKGVVIFPYVVISSNVKIGNHVMILSHVIVSHDDEIGDYSIITGGVNIAGGVKIGKSSYIGTNASIREGVKIGEGVLVGMGSVVLNDIPDGRVVVGNPARFLS